MADPFSIDSLQEAPELRKLLASDAVISGEVAHGDVADRPLATQGPIKPIETKVFPSAKVETVPQLRLHAFRYRL